jgi:peptidyl-prolyl cis-trans isomerase B (cyclophilin B)
LNKFALTAFLIAAALALVGCSAMPPGTVAPATVAPTAAPTAAPAPSPAAVATEPASQAAADTRPIVPAPPADGSRPLADVPPAERQDRFSGPAAPYVKPDANYVATIVTDKGNIVAELYRDTPEGLNNFVTLALNGFYDGLTFHRVEPNFVIQGGDPAGDGSGGPGYTTPAEINHPHLKGALAWARTGDNVNPERRSSGSQFYVTLDATSFLDGAYSVFGQVVEGQDVVEKIAAGDKIQRIDIAEAASSRLPTPAPTSTPNPPTAQEGRPLAKVAAAEREKLFSAAPEMTIDPSKSYQAVIKTAKGNVVVELNAALAPITVNNLVMLANLGFFDGMPVAHVEPGTYLLTGSPASNPGSDVGYAIPLEPAANAAGVLTGTLGMYPDPSSGGAKANGSQFFIALAAMPGSNIPVNAFGRVVEGLDIAGTLAIGDIIESITITEK